MATTMKDNVKAAFNVVCTSLNDPPTTDTVAASILKPLPPRPYSNANLVPYLGSITTDSDIAVNKDNVLTALKEMGNLVLPATKSAVGYSTAITNLTNPTTGINGSMLEDAIIAELKLLIPDLDTPDKKAIRTCIAFLKTHTNTATLGATLDFIVGTAGVVKPTLVGGKRRRSKSRKARKARRSKVSRRSKMSRRSRRSRKSRRYIMKV